MANEPETKLPERDRVRLLTFDVGGTVFDWHSTIRDEVSRIAADKGARVDAGRFANAWRRGMFEQLAEVRRGHAALDERRSVAPEGARRRSRRRASVAPQQR